MISGLYHPVMIPLQGTNPGDGEMSFWHVSGHNAEVFSLGIRFDAARITFLGEGFYTWQCREDCARMWAKPPKTILQIVVSPERWEALKVSEISSKWSGRYVLVNHLWVVRCLTRRNGCQRLISSYLTQILGDSDVVIAPAIGMAWKSRQVLWRDTPQCRAVLQNAHIDYIQRLPQAR